METVVPLGIFVIFGVVVLVKGEQLAKWERSYFRPGSEQEELSSAWKTRLAVAQAGAALGIAMAVVVIVVSLFS